MPKTTFSNKLQRCPTHPGENIDFVRCRCFKLIFYALNQLQNMASHTAAVEDETNVRDVSSHRRLGSDVSYAQ